MAEKIGVYFDKSSIGPYLDLEALAEAVKNKWSSQCPVVSLEDKLASEEGKQKIQQDIDNGTIDAVCVCGTSPRFDSEFFDFGPKVPVARTSLREHCVLAYDDPDGKSLEPGQETPEPLQALARDYVNMSVTNLQKTEPPEGEVLETEKRVLVLGGGWTGLNAALSVADSGYEAVVVEKEQELGGYAAKLYKTFPLSAPYEDAQFTGVDRLIESVQNHDKITVKTGTTLQRFDGQPGQFQATLKGGSGEEELSVGSMIVATGWEAQDTKYVEPLGYGKHKDVVTSMQFEEMAKKGEIVRPSDGKKPSSVVFILSFRSLLDEIVKEEEAQKAKEAEERAKLEEEQSDEEVAVEETFKKTESYRHLAFTNEITSLNSLKQARYVREFLPESLAYIVYEHMTIPGLNEHYYKAAQDDTGIMLTKGEVTSVYEEGNGSIVVRAEDTLIGDDIEIEADLVVVPTGLVPTTALDPVIKLAYRQGEAFPELELFDGFADSNYICFPYETRRTGIYAAGSVRQPQTLPRSAEDASGSALKAIQCLESVNRGMSVHPRSGDLTYPKFNFVRCTQCRRCTEECPFGALEEDAEGTPKPNIARCRRCGTCMGACPERVISFDNYSVGQIGSMITQVKVPDEFELGGPRILVLACENDAYPALDMAALRGRKWSPYVRIIPVRCLGSVNTIWIADAMGKGYDGALMLGCKYGDDYQCHFMKGSELCDRRMKNIGETLGRLGVEIERVQQEQVAIDDYDLIPDLINDFVDNIYKIGPNPFKGF
jgi:quinone-modifying oxidoreductase subunit QmoB